MKDNDIVYIVKNAQTNEELRYSLRSVEANFPHRKVWIFGGKPDYIHPDEFVRVRQVGITKWEKVRNTLLLICETKGVSEDFFLFNDDFYINNKVEKYEPVYDGDIYRHIIEIEERNYDKPSVYTAQLRQMVKELRRAVPDSPMLNYAVHMPILINKTKALEVLRRFQSPMFRTLYGNYWKIGGIDIKDGKIVRRNQTIEDSMTYLSSDDNAFMTQDIGRYIKKKFSKRSEYEDDKTR